MKGQIVIRAMTPEECAGQLEGVETEHITGIQIEADMVCTRGQAIEICRALINSFELSKIELFLLLKLLIDGPAKEAIYTTYGPDHGKTVSGPDEG